MKNFRSSPRLLSMLSTLPVNDPTGRPGSQHEQHGLLPAISARKRSTEEPPNGLVVLQATEVCMAIATGNTGSCNQPPAAH
jgi:hypothetical protein